MSADHQVVGESQSALFTLTAHRGEGMLLLAMDWKVGRPPDDFVGFSIEYREPGGDRFFALKNRLCFPRDDGSVDPRTLATTFSPIQKFRWVHFPRNAELDGDFHYRVSPLFMNDREELSVGEPQEVAIELRRETWPGQLNVAFTRGFVSSQAFVDRYQDAGPISTLLPAVADDGLRFTPTHPKTDEALRWMGFEARDAILDVLDDAVADSAAKVCVVAYDLNVPDVVSRLEALGPRLRIIIDDSDAHGHADSAETQAEERLVATAGRANVKRHHMADLQHNKTIVVDGPQRKTVVCGSTNFTWRGLFVQANNAIVLHGETPVERFALAFESYWNHDDVAGFGRDGATKLEGLGLAGIDAAVTFSPHTAANARLKDVAEDIGTTSSSLLYSLAFLSQTPGPVRNAIKTVTEDDDVFVYGMADHAVGTLDLQKPDGNVAPVHPEALVENVPEPFRSEPIGGGGARMHHKFVVIDFDKPTARVWMGSYNFSGSADRKNGENLLLIKDRRVAVAYAVEALRLFDHYHFRIAQEEAKTRRESLTLAMPPRGPQERPWWEEYYTDTSRIRDREMFA